MVVRRVGRKSAALHRNVLVGRIVSVLESVKLDGHAVGNTQVCSSGCASNIAAGARRIFGKSCSVANAAAETSDGRKTAILDHKSKSVSPARVEGQPKLKCA